MMEDVSIERDGYRLQNWIAITLLLYNNEISTGSVFAPR